MKVREFTLAIEALQETFPDIDIQDMEMIVDPDYCEEPVVLGLSVEEITKGFAEHGGQGDSEIPLDKLPPALKQLSEIREMMVVINIGHQDVLHFMASGQVIEMNYPAPDIDIKNSVSGRISGEGPSPSIREVNRWDIIDIHAKPD